MASAMASVAATGLPSSCRLQGVKCLSKSGVKGPLPQRRSRGGASTAVCALPSPAELSSLVLDTSMLAFVSAELPEGITYVIEKSDFTLSQEAIKSFYMIFSCVFAWGAVVFGSMNDAYYESDEYRNAGGNGTQFWMYERAEEEEETAREDLWREELRQEIEEKMEEIKELKSGEEEKATEVV